MGQGRRREERVIEKCISKGEVGKGVTEWQRGMKKERGRGKKEDKMDRIIVRSSGTY